MTVIGSYILGLDPTFQVTDHDNGRLECKCQDWRRSKLEVSSLNAPYPAPVCEHVLQVQRYGRDAGFLTRCHDIDHDPIVGWALRPGGFVRVHCEARGSTDGYWSVMLPSDLARQAPLVRDNLAEAGMVHESLGRKAIAQIVAPYYISFGATTRCSTCSRRVVADDEEDVDLFDDDQRLSALLWGSWLHAHGVCPTCSFSDLIPNI